MSRCNKSFEEKQKELKANCIRMRKHRENQTPEERQEELRANSIRNTLANKIPGPCEKMCIKMLKSNSTVEDKLHIVVYRNMLMAEHSLPAVQNRIAHAQDRINLLRSDQERACDGIKNGSVAKSYAAYISQSLEKAVHLHVLACAMESERESMRDLTRDILDLTLIDSDLPLGTKEYFMAKRELLQAGYDLEISQKASQKTRKVAYKAMLEYESVCRHINNTDMQRMAERLGESLKKAKIADKEAYLKVEELKSQHTSAEKLCDKAHYGYIILQDLQENDEKYKLLEEEHFSASGFTCHKCKDN